MNERTENSAAMNDDWLERVLVEDGREHRAGYLADDGFAARVAARLPAREALPAWRKPVLAVLWTIAAAGVVLVMPGVVADIAAEVVRLTGRHPISLAQIGLGLGALGAATWASAAYALRRNY